MVESYQRGLSNAVGETKVLLCGDTLQVKDYSRFAWTFFDPQAKLVRHETQFPQDEQKAFLLGQEIIRDPWQS